MVDSNYNTARSTDDMDKVVFRDMLTETNYYNRITSKCRMSRRDRYIQNNLKTDVRRFLNSDTKLDVRGIEKKELFHPT